SRSVPGRTRGGAAVARAPRVDLRVGGGAGDPRCDAWVSGAGGSRQLPSPHRGLEDQRNAEGLDRCRLAHPHGHREEPAAPGGGPTPPGSRHMSRREEIRGAVVLMAKAPREGFVKTRLTGAYPARDVVQLSECMLRDSLQLVQALPGVHVAVMCPSEDVAD